MPVLAPAEEPVVPAAKRTGQARETAAAVATPSATRRSGRYWYFLICLMTAVLFAAAGYLWGTRGPHPTPSKSAGGHPVPAPEAVLPPVKPTTAAPAASKSPDGVPPAPAKQTTEAEAALRAFLEAPDWQARAAFVVSAERERPAMREYAAAHGDGPVTFTSLTQLEKVDTTTIFKLGTPEFPGGFPVAVVDAGDGPKVDWESFIGFHDDQFWKFVQGSADHNGIFYVLVHQAQTDPSPVAENFASYRLSVPMPGRALLAWIRRDSVGFARMRSVFAGSGGFTQEEVRRLNETGVPVVLALAKHHAADGRAFVEIEDVVAVGWGPRMEVKKTANPADQNGENGG